MSSAANAPSAVPVNTSHGAASPHPTMPSLAVISIRTRLTEPLTFPTPCRRAILMGLSIRKSLIRSITGPLTRISAECLNRDQDDRCRLPPPFLAPKLHDVARRDLAVLSDWRLIVGATHRAPDFVVRDAAFFVAERRIGDRHCRHQLLGVGMLRVTEHRRARPDLDDFA